MDILELLEGLKGREVVATSVKDADTAALLFDDGTIFIATAEGFTIVKSLDCMIVWDNLSI